MKRIWIGGLLITGLVIGLTLRANAEDPTKKQCVNDARQERKTCAQVCNDTFFASIDSCRGVDHDCADTARDNRESCVQTAFDALNQCIDSGPKLFSGTDHTVFFLSHQALC